MIFSILVRDQANGKKLFRCSLCEYSSTRYTWLKLHIRVHTGEKPYTCDYCGRKFAWQTSRKVHLQHCREVPISADGKRVLPPSDGKKIPFKKIFKCNICGEKFLNEDTCKWHSGFCGENMKTEKVLERLMTSDDSWQCTFCEQMFDDDQAYLSHSASCSKFLDFQKEAMSKVAASETGLIKCKFCNRVFSTKGNWVRHAYFCSETFQAQKIIEKHLESNDTSLECPFCSEKLKNAEDYRDHSDSCSKKPRRKKETKVVETGPFKCEFCGKEFPFMKNCKRHANVCRQTLETQKIVEEMLQSNETLFQCFNCSKQFASETDCMNHAATCNDTLESELAVAELLRLGQP